MPQISLQEILLKQIVIAREIGLPVHRTVTTDYITLTDRKSNEKFKRIFRKLPSFRCYAFKALAADVKKAEMADGQLVSCAETRRFAAICG